MAWVVLHAWIQEEEEDDDPGPQFEGFEDGPSPLNEEGHIAEGVKVEEVPKDEADLLTEATGEGKDEL